LNGCNVFLDKHCLQSGQPWEEGFCDGLINSKIFVPLISKKAILNAETSRQNFVTLTPSSPIDNLFLELRLGVELRGMGMLEAIFPVFIGDTSIESDCPELSLNLSLEDLKSCTYLKFDGQLNLLPAITVDSVETKLREHLERAGLGVPLVDKATVAFVMGCISKHQGMFIQGIGADAFLSLSNDLLKITGIEKRIKRGSRNISILRAHVKAGKLRRSASFSNIITRQESKRNNLSIHHQIKNKLTSIADKAHKSVMLKSKLEKGNSLQYLRSSSSLHSFNNVLSGLNIDSKNQLESEIITGLKSQIDSFIVEMKSNAVDYNIQSNEIAELKKKLAETQGKNMELTQLVEVYKTVLAT